MNTYIILVEFSQADVATLEAERAALRVQAAAAGENRKNVTIDQLYLTTGEPQVVMIVRAPSGDRALETLEIFAATPPVDHTILEVAKNALRGIRSAFNGHTKM